MGLKSLKSRLILAVSSLVIGSGLLISLLVGQRYNSTLLETMVAQAENLAQAVALEAADKILINDQVALQKTLDHHMFSHPSIAYLFLLRGDEILAHSFSDGIPTGLIKANHIVSGQESRIQEVVSTKGEHYLDIAWPVFHGRAGVLRLGFSEGPFRTRANQLWLQMSGLILGILFLALGGTLLFVRRMTRPLAALVRATQKVDKGDLGARVPVKGQDEVATLASSFNHMVARIEEYTGRLEAQTIELERANQQTRTFCNVVREIGSLRSLNEIGSHLVRRFQDMLPCARKIAFMLLNSDSGAIYLFSDNQTKVVGESEHVQAFQHLLEELRSATLTRKFSAILPLEVRMSSESIAIPIRHEEQPFGALLILCNESCGCDAKDTDAISLILSQSAGVMRRALLDEEEVNKMRHRLGTSAEFSGLIGRDPRMQSIYRLIEEIGSTDATVLVQGESGTGKELVAKAIHQNSPRKDMPFVVINCSAYPSTLLESELFGHERGAFTGAARQKAGRFEQATGGTVFLDEIGEIPPSAQIKLLRVLQTKKFERLGGEKTIHVDVRIIAATNKDLVEEVKQGRFREDLFYRINVIPIPMPPLRERRNDIPILAKHFLRYFAGEQKKSVAEFSPDAMRLLLDHGWPGNVRELQNTIEHAAVLAKSRQIETADLPSALHRSHLPGKTSGSLVTLVDNEKDLLIKALGQCGWNKKEAAKRLGISRNTLYMKMKKHQIHHPTTH